jgi:hypothetical protein
MPSLPLTYLETIPPQEKVSAPDAPQLPPQWAAGLDQLKTVCEHAAQVERQQRLLLTQTFQQIAQLVGEAGYANLELPRDYEVRRVDRQWVLVKCFPPLHPENSATNSPREVRFVASGEESLWTRFNLQVTRPSDEQIAELMADLESGLIAEIVQWVQNRTATLPPSAHPMPPESNDSNRLRLVDLGRPKRLASNELPRIMA